jgi:pimeloyl-ACP methyl ester carboxylesterase
VKLVPNSRLVVYENAPHGLYMTHRERLNHDLLAFIDRCRGEFDGAPPNSGYELR